LYVRVTLLGIASGKLVKESTTVRTTKAITNTMTAIPAFLLIEFSPFIG
jgi:hypothetical protein